MHSNFLIVPVVKEKIKVKLAFIIPTGAPITVVKEIADTPPLVACRKNNYFIFKNFIYVINCCYIFN